MISLKCGLIDPLTGTQNRGTAFMAYRMAHITQRPYRTKPGFSALLDRIEGNGVRTVLVEDASRFARQLIVQEAGIIALIERGVRVLTASGDDLTASEDPFKVAMRQIAGVFAQLEKARLVGKLKAARDRKRASGVKVEGRKSYAEIDRR